MMNKALLIKVFSTLLVIAVVAIIFASTQVKVSNVPEESAKVKESTVPEKSVKVESSGVPENSPDPPIEPQSRPDYEQKPKEVMPKPAVEDFTKANATPENDSIVTSQSNHEPGHVDSILPVIGSESREQQTPSAVSGIMQVRTDERNDILPNFKFEDSECEALDRIEYHDAQPYIGSIFDDDDSNDESEPRGPPSIPSQAMLDVLNGEENDYNVVPQTSTHEISEVSEAPDAEHPVVESESELIQCCPKGHKHSKSVLTAGMNSREFLCPTCRFPLIESQYDLASVIKSLIQINILRDNYGYGSIRFLERTDVTKDEMYDAIAGHIQLFKDTPRSYEESEYWKNLVKNLLSNNDLDQLEVFLDLGFADLIGDIIFAPEVFHSLDSELQLNHLRTEQLFSTKSYFEKFLMLLNHPKANKESIISSGIGNTFVMSAIKMNEFESFKSILIALPDLDLSQIFINTCAEFYRQPFFYHMIGKESVDITYTDKSGRNALKMSITNSCHHEKYVQAILASPKITDEYLVEVNRAMKFSLLNYLIKHRYKFKDHFERIFAAMPLEDQVEAFSTICAVEKEFFASECFEYACEHESFGEFAFTRAKDTSFALQYTIFRNNIEATLALLASDKVSSEKKAEALNEINSVFEKSYLELAREMQSDEIQAQLDLIYQQNQD